MTCNLNVDVDMAVAENSFRAARAKVLVVDDDQFFRELVKRILTAAGYEIFEARSTAEAEAYLKCKPDIAVIDYRLPNQDGVAYIESLRGRGYSFPIVFCSGSTYSQQTLSNVRNLLGVDLILRKPIDTNKFLEHIQSLLPIINDELVTDEVAVPEHDSEADQDPAPKTEDNEIETFDLQTVPQLTDHQAESRPELNQVEADERADTSEDETQIQDILKDLTAEYMSELPSMISTIRTDFINAIDCRSQESLETASDLAHRIRGTAGSFGLKEVSKLAGQIEDNVDNIELCNAENIDHEYVVVLINSLADIVAGMTQPAIVSQADTFNLENYAPIEIPNEIAEETKAPHFKKILFVAHDKTLTEAIVGALTDCVPCEVTTASTAIEVLPLLNSTRPDIILIDSDLPDICGNNLCKMIRCNPLWADLRIITILGNSALEERDAAYEAGASDYLMKPVIKRELQERMKL